MRDRPLTPDELASLHEARAWAAMLADAAEEREREEWMALDDHELGNCYVRRTAQEVTYE